MAGYLYIPSGYLGRVIPGHPSVQLPAPGSTSRFPVSSRQSTRRSSGTVTTREALFGNIPWVRGPPALPGPKGVMVHREFCALLLRSSRKERHSDRIATG